MSSTDLVAQQAILRSLSHDLKQPIRSIRRRIAKARAEENSAYVDVRLDGLDKFMINISSQISEYRELAKNRNVTFREIETFVGEGVGQRVALFQERVREASLFPEADTSPAFRENIRFADVHSRRFLRRVRSIQNFAKAHGGIVYSRFGLHNEVGRVLGDIESLVLDHQASVRVTGSEAVSADQIKIGIALQNLIENAIKYRSPARPCIVEVVIYSVATRSAEPRQPEGKVVMDASPSAPPPRWTVVEVRDNGRGVKPVEQAAIFEMFRRSPEAADVEEGGTGLGLAILAHIVRTHCGRVGVDSAYGAGSNFWFMLPQGSEPGERFMAAA